LNFLETWRQWRQHRRPGQHLYFTTFEAYPLEAKAVIRAISAWPDLSEPLSRLVHHLPGLTATPTAWTMDGQTTLTLVRAPALEGVGDWQKKAHAWYLDGFSPRCNPDMWSAELMAEVFSHTHDTGTFATYTSAGWVRRNLQSSGFYVKKAPGHGSKRHMLTGMRDG
jgi:tRNA U34 5-methylaminomethyl-2-thiouridine-forming methyltransferase MnmC